MGCACNRGREQFEVVRDGGTGRVVFRTANRGTALGVQGRYPGSVVRSTKDNKIVDPGKGELELVASDGTVLVRADDAQLLAKVAAAHEGATAREAGTGKAFELPPYTGKRRLAR
ncbi:hypothetical protein [Streptomyces sp. AD55]|uniref:hypothetical protein n=1 Tax=Streptomyces sp. AD55 TaxID=3242895 RepID=UPI003528B01B